MYIFIPIVNNKIYYVLQCGFCVVSYLRNLCNAVSVLLQKYNELSPKHLHLQRNNDEVVKNLKQQATHLNITRRHTAPSHSCFKPRVLSNNSDIGWLTSASHNTADPAQTRSYGTWNSMPVRLLREPSQCKSQFLRQREKKERPTIGPGLPIHLSDDFWNTMWGAAKSTWGYKSHCLLKNAVFTSNRTIAKTGARQISTSAGTVRRVDGSRNDQLHSPHMPKMCLFVNEPGARVWNQGTSDAAKV